MIYEISDIWYSPTYLAKIEPIKMPDTVNVYALLLAFENL